MSEDLCSLKMDSSFSRKIKKCHQVDTSRQEPPCHVTQATSSRGQPFPPGRSPSSWVLWVMRVESFVLFQCFFCYLGEGKGGKYKEEKGLEKVTLLFPCSQTGSPEPQAAGPPEGGLAATANMVQANSFLLDRMCTRMGWGGLKGWGGEF